MRSFTVVHSTSDPLVERSFTLVIFTFPPIFFQKKRENDFYWWESNPGLIITEVDKKIFPVSYLDEIQ